VAVAHVSSFGGGVVLEGGADSQRTDELKSCEGFDIGPRGALIATRDVSDYVTINDLAGAPAAWSKVYGLSSAWGGSDLLNQIAVGEGNNGATLRFLLAKFLRSGATSPIGGADILLFDAPSGGATPAPAGINNGVLVTFAELTEQVRLNILGANRYCHVLLINIGHREITLPEASGGPGLYALVYDPNGVSIILRAINYYDALGTGPDGEYKVASGNPGTLSKQLYFRGIAAYNAHAFGWGYENGRYLGNAPSRLAFSNPRNPLKWGNDNQAASGDRSFSDTDALPIGDAGEIIRGALSWRGRLWVGTDRQLHYVSGYGRDTFVTDSATPVAKAENILGPRCLVEGPDGLLYGLGDQGLWAFDGASFERHHRRLRDYHGESPGWWDYIWTDRSKSDTYPGKTNQDLCWMVADWDTEQVIVGIPHASTTTTVLVKFHVRTGGFTKQVFTNANYTAADYVRRQRQYDTKRFLSTPTSGQVTVKRIRIATGEDASDPLVAGSGYMPAATTLKTEFGPYALFGPNGVGVYRKAYLTIAFEDDLFGVGGIEAIQYTVTPYVDDQAMASFKLTINSTAPASPSNGDFWLDTSGTDTNLGNATAGTLISAAADYVYKRRRNNAWEIVPVGGQKGKRATLPIAWTPTRGTRCSIKLEGVTGNIRHQFEGLGFLPPVLKDAA